MNGYIKLFRKIQEWEWYKDNATFKVFLHLLLVANRKDEEWHGMTVKRGQRLTSRKHLAEETGLSVQQIRTALSHLQITQEITMLTTKTYTLITVEKYDDYQCEDKASNQESNPQIPHRATTNGEEENIRSIKENIKRKSERNIIPPTLEMVRAYCLERNNNVDAEKFVDFYQSKNWFVGKNKMKDWQAAVRTWEKKDGRSDAVTKTMKDLKGIYNGMSQDEYDEMERRFNNG